MLQENYTYKSYLAVPENKPTNFSYNKSLSFYIDLLLWDSNS